MLTLSRAFGVQTPSIFPIAQILTAVWVNHDTRMPVHCAAKVTRGGTFYKTVNKCINPLNKALDQPYNAQSSYPEYTPTPAPTTRA